MEPAGIEPATSSMPRKRAPAAPRPHVLAPSRGTGEGYQRTGPGGSADVLPETVQHPLAEGTRHVGAKLVIVAQSRAGTPDRLKFTTSPIQLSVCRLDSRDPIPSWGSGGRVWSVSRSDSELSIVCEASRVPAGVVRSGPWRALIVQGPLDQELVGILASITATLAAAQVPVFAISTYNTDWVLVPEDRLRKALAALRAAGHQLGP